MMEKHWHTIEILKEVAEKAKLEGSIDVYDDVIDTLVLINNFKKPSSRKSRAEAEKKAIKRSDKLSIKTIVKAGKRYAIIPIELLHGSLIKI